MKSGFIGGLLTGFALAALAAGLFFMITLAHFEAASDKRYVYFASTNDGRLMQLSPLNERHITDLALISWVAQITTGAMTFGYNDRTARLHSYAPAFSTEGWQAFTQVLSANGWDEKSDHRQPYYVTTPATAPTIRQQGVKDGIFTWVITAPMLVTTRTPDNQTGTNAAYNATIVVQRARDLNKPEGMEIAGFSLTPAR